MLDNRDPQQFDPDASIGDMMGRVVEDARELVEAEVNLAKAKAKSEVRQYKMPAVLAVAAFALVVAALVAFAVGITMAIATLIGPLAGGVIAALIFAGAALACLKVAQRKLENK